MNNQIFCVYDFETAGKDAETTSPVQLAAIMIHPRTLKEIEGGTFSSRMQPEKDKDGNLIYDSSTLTFHAKNRGMSEKDILKEWEDSPHPKHVWEAFVKFVERFHKQGTKRKSKYSAPIRCGYNIINFDNIILERMCNLYGPVDKDKKQNMFYPRDNVDLLNWMFAWFENNAEVEKFNLDYLRTYFGISNEGAHDALVDVKQTAELMRRFLRLHRNFASKVKFKGSFNE